MQPYLDTTVIQELRTRAASGDAASALATWLVQSVGTSRLLAVAYFREAFFLSLGDAKAVGGAPIFGGLLRHEEWVDAELAAAMERTKKRWATSP